MRTSHTQFEVMVEFMERHGDLNKPADGPQGRLYIGQLWKKLTDTLNMDVSGDKKPTEKWKKVWSDLKNNTKRKAAKIHRATTQTGGGPACRLILSDLEQRVLSIIGVQSATGLIDIEEVGVELASSTNEQGGHHQPVNPTPIDPIDPIVFLVESTPEEQVEKDNQLHLSSQAEYSRDHTPHSSSDVSPGNNRPRYLTTQRNIPRARRNTPRPIQADTASRFFAESDERWRTLFSQVTTVFKAAPNRTTATGSMAKFI